jgi:hypothetical protein
VGDTGIEPVTSSVSGINTMLSTPPLSTKTVRGRPLTSAHIRGRCHAISQSRRQRHIRGTFTDVPRGPAYGSKTSAWLWTEHASWPETAHDGAWLVAVAFLPGQWT